jgi:hypothetical protein
MVANSRYPARYTILAGLAGAIAWGLPYPISPFLRLIPFMPDLPKYSSPPFQVPLAELTLAYALSGIIAGGLFFWGIRSKSNEGAFRPSLSPGIIFSTLAGLAAGGALAILIGLLLSTTPGGYRLAYSLGFGTGSIEPYLSLGRILGTALASFIIVSSSGIRKQFVPANGSPALPALKIVLRVAGITLAVRLVTLFVEFSSFIKYTYGDSIMTFMLFQAASGMIFGIWAWRSCSSFNMRHTVPAEQPL